VGLDDAIPTSPARGGRRSRGTATEERGSTVTLPLKLVLYCTDPSGGEGLLCQREHLGKLDSELCTAREAGWLLPLVRFLRVSPKETAGG
jgi:hypothetical protein